MHNKDVAALGYATGVFTSRRIRQAIDETIPFNITTILAPENASFVNLVKLNIYLLSGCDPRIGYKAFQEVAGLLEKPLLVIVLFVSEFARPGCLLEIDGITVVEDFKFAL